MASTKIDEVWQLLSMYEFGNDIPENYHCIICKRVAIKPYKALCECSFCFECINDYLKDGRKQCPGIKNDCAEEYLEIDVNISKDIRGIRNIGRISVECLNEMCEVRCDLENMNDHLRVCGMSKNKCPYENIGCQLRQISEDNVKTHYDNEWLSHSKLLIEAIYNLRNDVEELKKVVERRDEKIYKLSEDSVAKEMTIREMEEMKEEFRIMKETQKKTAEELENVKKDTLERDLNKNILINKINQQADDQRKEMEEMKVKDERRDREMKLMKETQKKKMNEEWENVGYIENQMKSLNELRVNQKNIEREINSVIIKVRDAGIFDEKREFLWRVDNFSKVTDNNEPRHFILMRYSRRFCVVLNCLNGSLHLICRVMKCEFDNNNLIWPMSHKITLSLINQESMKIHKSQTYKYNTFKYKNAFYPTLDDWNNSYIGFGTTLKDITDSPGVLLNDSLIVSFQIEY